MAILGLVAAFSKILVVVLIASASLIVDEVAKGSPTIICNSSFEILWA